MGLRVYVMVSYGPKPEAEPWKAHGARSQRSTLTGFAKARGATIDVVVSDYARAVRTLDDLPNLKKTLEELRSEGRGALILDGVGRIMSRAKHADRKKLVEELVPYLAHMFDIRIGAFLSSLSGRQLAAIAMYSRTPKKRLVFEAADTEAAKRDRQHQTKAAVASSLRVRREKADARARVLGEIRQVLLDQGERARPVDIAREANRRGMTTAREKAWTSTAVSLALKRLKGKGDE